MVDKKIPKENFGPFIRKLRINLNITQRDLAKRAGIAPSYLNDLEKEKRSAPKLAVIKKISNILKTDFNKLSDLAGNSKKEIAPDLSDFIQKNPKIVSLLRSIKEKNLSNEQLSDIENSINKKIKALIIAAGLGSRLKNHTENLPKCMLDFGGKTLLQRQLHAYQKNEIKDISLIKGYKKKR